MPIDVELFRNLLKIYDLGEHIEYITLPKLLIKAVERFGRDKISFREKDFGVWQEYTWQNYFECVRNLSLGLEELGLKKGDRVSILSQNRPEWLYAELAVQSIGAVPTGIPPDALAYEAQHIINHSETIIIFVEDQEELDKCLLEDEKFLPLVQWIIYDDPKGMRKYQSSRIISFREVLAIGEKIYSRDPKRFLNNVNQGMMEDLALVSYTSGTTGLPKGVMVSHMNLIANSASLLNLDRMDEKDNFLSIIALPYMGEQTMGLTCHLLSGFTYNFPEEPETVNENIREIGPSSVLFLPRTWENICSTIQVRIADTIAIKRLAFNIGMKIGRLRAKMEINGTHIPIWLKLAYIFAIFIAFKGVLDKQGLSRLKRAYTVGAAIGPEIFLFFRALGINLKQTYGIAEVSGLCSVQPDEGVNANTSGSALKGFQIKISDRKEILVKGPAVFHGYLNNPEDSKRALKDGWYYTGDAGYFDEKKHLVVIDRIKDLLMLSDGSVFSPQYIENKLKFSPYIKDAVVIGQDKPFLVVLISLDMGTMEKWCEENHVGFTTYSDLSQKEEIYELIGKEITDLIVDLSDVAKVRRFSVLYKELDSDDEELTRTKKVRRNIVSDRYKEVVEGMYSGEKEVKTIAKVKFEGAREKTIQTSVKVQDIKL